MKEYLYNLLMQEDIENAIRENEKELLDIIPEIKLMIGFNHKHPHHHLDVWNHTLYALSLSQPDFIIRLTLLLHDIGKPVSFTEGEVRHFHNHPLVSSIIAGKILLRLGYDEDTINTVVYLVKNHDSKITQKQIENNYNLCLKLYNVQYCDAMAHHPDKLDKRRKYLEETYRKIRVYTPKR